MPKLKDLTLDEVGKTIHGYQYSNISIDKLGASEYTIVHSVIDKSGSVHPFKNDLEKMIKAVVEACKKNARAENLLLRTTAFNANNYGATIEEIHGFSTLDVIDPDKYIGSIKPDGSTPLFQASLEATEALIDFGKKLYQKKFICNAILFIITDGEDNASNCSPEAVKIAIENIRLENIIESFRTILIGVNDTDSRLKNYLEDFKQQAGIDEYISIGEATPGKLAKLAQFVSQSISSQSQALNSGGPSQPIDFKF